jgi:hypothetical protein
MANACNSLGVTKEPPAAVVKSGHKRLRLVRRVQWGLTLPSTSARQLVSASFESDAQRTTVDHTRTKA